jgi:Ca-activated chloride channel family protein
MTRLGSSQFLWLTVVALGALVAAVWGLKQRRLAVEVLARYGRRPPDRGRHRLRVVRVSVAAAALATLAFVAARPQGAAIEAMEADRGLDVVIVADVSASMLAEDVKPSRLERARAVLLDLANRLDGNRLGLVAFAGRSATLAPLSVDTRAVRLFAEQLDVTVVDEQGTSLQRGVERGLELLSAASGTSRVLVVLSDGEDLEAAAAERAARFATRARAAGVYTIAVGFGTPEGGPIPTAANGGRAVKLDAAGRVVITRLRAELLAALADAYIPAETGDEGRRAAELALALPAAPGEHAVVRREELYQVPLLLAFVLLLVESGLARRWD